MKMTRDEHVLGFKFCDISIYWWIWMLSFLLEQIWIGMDYFVLNFISNFGTVLGLQDRRLTVDCRHQHVGT